MAKSEVGTSSHLEVNGGAADSDLGSVTWPSGTQSGDIAYLFCSYYQVGNTFNIATPAGWDSRGSKSAIDGSAGGANTSVVQVLTKHLTSTESGTLTIACTNVSGSPTVYGNFILIVFRGDGALTHASINTLNVVDNQSYATGTGVDATSGQLLVACFGLTDPPGATSADPSGMTLGHTGGTAVNTGSIYWQSISSTAGTGDKTWDFANTRDSGTWMMLADDAGASSSYVFNPLTGRGGGAAQPLVQMRA